MNNPDWFITSDMTLTAVLIFFGEPLVDVQKNLKAEIEFCFNQSAEMQNLIQAYSLGELSVEPRRFSIVLRDVKKIIFVQKNDMERRPER